MWTLVDTDESDKKAPETLASRLPDFADNSIEDNLMAPPRPATRKPVWQLLAYSLAGLFLLAGLLAQVAYRHIEAIATHTAVTQPQLRPWLLTFCDTTGCILPPTQDAGLIRSERLSVEPHPEYQEVLQLELDFRNTADVAQALPVIAVVFSDIQGNTVAGRHFSASEYLPDSPLTRTQVTRKQVARNMLAGAVHTAQLNLADPGASAVNYEVRFLYEPSYE